MLCRIPKKRLHKELSHQELSHRHLLFRIPVQKKTLTHGSDMSMKRGMEPLGMKISAGPPERETIRRTIFALKPFIVYM
jgi:hypothetical protein